MPARVVIVGAGECGLRAAQALRQRGFDGTLTLVGEEPHLPYERPPLSKEISTSEAELLARTISDGASLAAIGIDCLMECAAIGIDRTAKLVALAGGAILGYDPLLLATGAVPRRLALPVNRKPRASDRICPSRRICISLYAVWYADY